MKKIFVLLAVLFIANLAYCQVFEFKSYGLVNKYTGNSVVNVSAKLMIRKSGKNYQLKAYDPRRGNVAMSCDVSYLKSDNISGAYIYKGVVMFGPIKHGCILTSLTKLSDFAKGKGNQGNFAFVNTYRIRIRYGNIRSRPYNYNQRVSIFPIQ